MLTFFDSSWIQGKFLSCSFLKLPWSYSWKSNPIALCNSKYLCNFWFSHSWSLSCRNRFSSELANTIERRMRKPEVDHAFQWLSVWFYFADLAKRSIVLIKTVFLALFVSEHWVWVHKKNFSTTWWPKQLFFSLNFLLSLCLHKLFEFVMDFCYVCGFDAS